MSQAPGAHVASELETTPYVHVRGIARGGHGEVHVVEHRELGGQSVMKLLHKRDPGVAEELTRRLRTEGRILRGLKHRNIVEVLDFGFTKTDRAYLVTELLAGRTLKEELTSRGPLPLGEAIDIVDQTLQGLEAAHKAGLVHRDLKPENLFYVEAAPSGERLLKILDFGIAKLVTEEAKERAGDILPTAKDMLLGTPNYISPEQVKCAPIDARTDIYAMGGVLFFLLTGRNPFIAKDLAGLLQAHLQDPPPSPSGQRPDLPAAIDELIARAMAKRPEDRFKTARAMLDEMDRIKELLSAEHVPTAPIIRRTVRMTPQPERLEAPKPATTAADHDTLLDPAPPGMKNESGPKPPVISTEPIPAGRSRAATMKMPIQPEKSPRAEAPREPRERPPRSLTFSERIPRAYRIAIWILSVIVAALALRLLERCAHGCEAEALPSVASGSPTLQGLASGAPTPDTSTRPLPTPNATGYPVTSEGTMTQQEKGPNDAGAGKPIGPRGTLAIASMTNPSNDAEAAPSTTRGSFMDDDPTPIDPPSFDLAALDSKAAALPTRVSGRVPVLGPNDFKVGEQFRSYVVLGPLAVGGLSWLYDVSHIDTRAKAVLKVLKPDYRADQMLSERMFAEGRLAKSMPNNPYICRVFEVGKDERVGCFIIMEHLKGRALSALIQERVTQGKTFPVKAALNSGITIAEALHLLHMGGAVHRDVKPDNVFVVQHGDGTTSLRIIDFGAAKSQYSPHTSHEETTIGTLAYMAPEQSSRRTITQAADQYSLACVIYEMLFQFVYANKVGKQGRRAAELLGLHLHEPISAPPAHLVPAPLWRILQKALHKEPERRYPSTEAFAVAMRTFLASDWTLAPVPDVLTMPVRPTAPSVRMLQEWLPKQGIEQIPPSTPTLPAEPPEPRRRIPAEEVFAAATLLVFAPPQLRGQRYELGKEGLIGRHPGIANVVIDNDTVSNEHLYYSVVNDDPENPVYAIENRSKNNGTHLGGLPIEVHSLQPDQILELGDVKLCLLPAGAITADLKQFRPTRDLLGHVKAEEPRRRTSRRKLGLHEPWRKPSIVLLAPAELAGTRYDLGVHGIMGRNEDDADIVFDHESVSRAHLEYSMTTGGSANGERIVYLVKDLGSANKVFATDPTTGNRRAIAHDAIFGGERVKLGSVEFVIRPPGNKSPSSDEWILLDGTAARRDLISAGLSPRSTSGPDVATAIVPSARKQSLTLPIMGVVLLGIIAAILGYIALHQQGGAP